MRRTAAALLLLAALPVEAAESPAVTACAARAEEGAVEICREAARQRPQDPAVLRNLARSLIVVGAFDEAARAQGRVLEMLPNDWAANYDLAGTLGFIRRYSEALEPILKAVALRPDHVPGHQAAAVIYGLLGLHPEAVGATRRAADLGSVTAMFDMVRYYEEGLGVAADERAAFRWMVRAAEAGHVYAMRKLTYIYLEGGYGEPPDDAKAEEWAMRHREAKRRRD